MLRRKFCVKTERIEKEMSKKKLSNQYSVMSTEHRPFVENLGNYVIVQVRGDGACMFNAVAAGIYGSDKQSWVLRSLFHYFIVEHWDFYKVPFKETVGVGGRQEVYVNFSSDF